MPSHRGRDLTHPGPKRPARPTQRLPGKALRSARREATEHGMNRRPRIAIIGGGIAGLAAALALFRRGIEVAVYEQAGELSEIGAGVQMTPNAMKALFALGLEAAALRVAFEPEGQVLRNW